MKKLIAMISAIAVICTMSLTSFAEITVASNTEVTGTSLAKGATSGYDASYTSDKVNTQTTIIAVKGTEINTSSIQYINQLTQDSETVINFDLKDTLNAGETVTVYMGGDAIGKTKIGTIANAAAVQKFTVTFYDEDGTTQLQTAEYESGATLTAPANPSKAEDENYTYAFAGWALKSAPTAVISLPATVTEAAEYVAVYTATEKEVGGGEDTETVTISYQLVNVDITSSTVDSAVGTATLNSGDVIYTSMTEPTLSKYAFVGWYTDSALTTKLDKTATATEAMTIYAKMAKIYKRGDANLDSKGNVTAADATAISQWLAAGKPSSSSIGVKMPGTNIKYGEANGDSKGNVTAADATAISQWLAAGKPSDSIIGGTVEITKD